MTRALGLLALGALLAAAGLVLPSSAAFTAASAGQSSSFGTASDWVAPAVTLTAPADGSFTNDPTPALSGAAGSATGDGATVTVRIYAGSSAGGTPVQTLARARSGATWSATATTLADGTYTAQATQADSAGNTGTSAARSFTVDTMAPAATAISTANAGNGVSGRVGSGDSITFTYSEPIAPTSVLSTFTGSTAAVTVRFFNDSQYGDLLTVLDGSGSATVNLDIGSASGLDGGVWTAANFVTGAVSFPGTMTRSADGRSLTIVLGSPDRSNRIVAGPAAAADMIWAPKAGPLDRAGNGLADTDWVSETDDDRDF